MRLVALSFSRIGARTTPRTLALVLLGLLVLASGGVLAQSAQTPPPASPPPSTGTAQPAAGPAAQPATPAQPPSNPSAPNEQAPPPPPAPPPAGQAASAQPQRPLFRGGVDVVSLNVTVTDPANKSYVRDLERGDFAVYEDGVKQELTYFTRQPLPIALSLLIDTSASMEDKMATTQEAATGFVKRLRDNDLGQVIDFDNRVTIQQQFTSDQTLLEKAIRATVPNGSTSLHNAVYISLKELKKVRAKDTEDVRRQAIVVLSDGEDTSSLVPFEEVLELAKRSEVAIYTIAIRGAREGGTRNFNEAEFVLRQFAQETGGRSFFPTSVGELDGIYTQISEELASQYMMAYESRNPRRDGRWRRVVVRTTRPNVVARTKQGYYGPTNQ